MQLHSMGDTLLSRILMPGGCFVRSREKLLPGSELGARAPGARVQFLGVLSLSLFSTLGWRHADFWLAHFITSGEGLEHSTSPFACSGSGQFGAKEREAGAFLASRTDALPVTFHGPQMPLSL